MKKVNYIIFIFFALASVFCSKQFERNYEYFKYFDLYSLKGREVVNSTLFISKPYVKIAKDNDSIFIEIKRNNCTYNETYKLINKDVWFSKRIIEGKTKGKLIINSEASYKYVYNDTVLVYLDFGVKLANLDYKPKFNSIQIQTKFRNLEIQFPNFNHKKEKLLISDIQYLKNNCKKSIIKNKTFVNGNLYVDVTETDYFEDKIYKYTIFYELNGQSECFLMIDECCSSFKGSRLKYGQRLL